MEWNCLRKELMRNFCVHFFLTLNAPTATKVVCFSRLLKCLRSHIGAVCSGSMLFASILN